MDSLLVAAPVLVFTLVALLGFTGCWLDTRGITGPVVQQQPDTYAKEVQNSSPIAFWKLVDPVGSQQAKDEIGAPPGGHPGDYVGDYLLGGQQPSLDASDPNVTPVVFSGGHVEVVHDQALESQSFTVEAWVLPNTDDPPVFGTIVSSFGAEQGWELFCTPPSPSDTDVYGYWSAQVGTGTGSGGPLVVFDPKKLVSAVHLAMTYDGVLRLYRDGALEAEFPTEYAANTQEPLEIGTGFRGAIQDVAVYDRALDAAEITTHFMANQAPDGQTDGS